MNVLKLQRYESQHPGNPGPVSARNGDGDELR